MGTKASNADKDVSIVVTSGTTKLLTHGVMVRVRKNAETLSADERRRFLEAFVKAARLNNQFARYWGVHTDAVRLAHRMAFLPWHRALLIQLERELQVEDPSVALPYWEFDKPAPKLFSEDFFGRVGGAANPSLVVFSTTNPLAGWGLTDPRVSPLTRFRNGDTSVSSGIHKNFMRSNEHRVMTDAIFGPYHGAAHVFIGGLVGSIERSPADPLFFLLHANVDRAWAAWQRLYDRFDQTKPLAYGLQGSFGAGSTLPLGNHVQDTMWPWDGIVRPSDPVVETIGSVPLPPNPGPGGGLSGNPKVGDTLDYLDSLGRGLGHGFCYDTIPFGTGPVDTFWTP